MKKLSLSELVPLPEKNRQEADRMLVNYEKHIKELADIKAQLKLQAIRKKLSDLHEGGNENVNTA